MRLWARSGIDYTTCLDRIRLAIAALPAASIALDGEAVAFGDDGCASFGALRSLEGQAGAIMIAYDLLDIDGLDVRTQPLADRRKLLARVLARPKGVAPQAVADGLVLSEAIEGHKGEAMFRQACLMGLEGIVSKRLDSRYVSGRTRAWLKIKNPAFERL